MKKEIKQLQEKAREKFDELWDKVYIYKPNFYEQMPEEEWLEVTPSVKDFIDTLIEQTYKQGREDVNKHITECIVTLDYSKNGDEYERGAWDAINDILKHLTNKQ
jgi:hypothetical protein